MVCKYQKTGQGPQELQFRSYVQQRVAKILFYKYRFTMTDTNTKPNKHEAERCTGQVWALNTCSNQPHFIEVRRLSGHVCVLDTRRVIGHVYAC